MASVREIAKQANVSKTTVSMVLNNREGVSENLRRRVREAVKQLHVLEEARAAEQSATQPEVQPFDPQYSPRGEEKPVSILVLHPSSVRSSAVFHEIIHGIQAAVSFYKVQLSLAFNDADLLNGRLSAMYFKDPVLRPSGVLVLGSRIDDPLVKQIQALQIPVLLIGRPPQPPGISAIGRDEEAASFEAVNYLLDLGHRNIAFLGGSEKYHYTFQRQAGFRNALLQRGLTAREDWIVPGFHEAEAARFLQNTPEITAALFVNELYATQVLPLVQAAGLRIPEDLSAIGFDDTDLSRDFCPPLTSVSFPFYQEGFWAVRMLIEQIRQPIIVSAQITFRATLMVRQSCGPPKSP